MLSLIKMLPRDFWYIVVIFLLTAAGLFFHQRAKQWNDRYEALELSYQDSVETLQLKNGALITKTRTIEGDNIVFKSLLENQMSDLNSVLKEQNIKLRQLQNITRTQSQLIANFNPEVYLDSSLFSVDSINTIKLNYKDSTWIEMTASVPMRKCIPIQSATQMKVSAYLPLDLIIYEDRKRWFGWKWTPKWFGSRFHETQATTPNPHIEITNIKSIIKKR